MYMTVSGAPVKKTRHAEPISAMALDTLEAVKNIKNPANNKPMTVTIGKRVHPYYIAVAGWIYKSSAPGILTTVVITSDRSKHDASRTEVKK